MTDTGANGPKPADSGNLSALPRWSRRALLHRSWQLGLGVPAFIPPFARFQTTFAARPSLFVPSTQDRANHLTVILHHNQFNFDPHESYGDASVVLLGVYEMLVQLHGDRPDEVEPMLADTWEANASKSSYTFHLSPRAVFHDGSPCDADAVKASFVRFLGLGALPVNIIRRFFQDPEQIVVLDQHTIRFDLSRPQPLFLSALASPFGPYVVNPRVVDAYRTSEDPWAHEWLTGNTAGAGTGPYAVLEHLPNEHTILKRFDDYHRGWTGEHFNEIALRVVPEDFTRRELLERGDADIVTRLLTPDDVAALATVPTLRVEIYDSFDVGWVVMNAFKLRTAEVRRGFSYAFPYDEVVTKVEGGLRKRTGPLPDGIRGYDPDVFLYPTDLARARELILSGGFQDGDRFDYMYLTGNESARAIAQLFQANVQAIGFDLDLIEVEQSTLFDIGFGELPAEDRPVFNGSWGWYPDYDDPWSQLAPCFLRSFTEGGEGTANAGLWVNDRFEQIMAEAKIYSDEARLVQLMKEAQRILTEEDPPCIYIGQQRYVAVRAEDIRGFDGNPLYLNLYRFYKMHRADA